ncbi:MAG: hypothetical protein U0836_26570 [Pirellulales bacterium]
MLSERVALDILQEVKLGIATVRTTFRGGEPSEEVVPHSSTLGRLLSTLLSRHSYEDIVATVEFLESCEYLGRTEFGLRGPWCYTLLGKGRLVADAGSFTPEERTTFYGGVTPLSVFVAYQFNEGDSQLFRYLKEDLLEKTGFSVVDGRAEGLEDFRTSILDKIRRCQFFLCLLTKRGQLSGGGHVSSVWLYQETGVAIAYGKKPLLLVDRELDRQYVEGLQSIYEHVPFTLHSHAKDFREVLRRLRKELDNSGCAVPETLLQVLEN